MITKRDFILHCSYFYVRSVYSHKPFKIARRSDNMVFQDVIEEIGISKQETEEIFDLICIQKGNANYYFTNCKIAGQRNINFN